MILRVLWINPHIMSNRVKVSVKQNWSDLVASVTYCVMVWKCLQKLNISQCQNIALTVWM